MSQEFKKLQKMIVPFGFAVGVCIGVFSKFDSFATAQMPTVEPEINTAPTEVQEAVTYCLPQKRINSDKIDCVGIYVDPEVCNNTRATFLQKPNPYLNLKKQFPLPCEVRKPFEDTVKE